MWVSHTQSDHFAPSTRVRWKMDEAEKYQQRLQAIAEKRRLQEEEDRAKREMEDQKLRDQQRKRKSLRDQWLNEGPPSSPESPGPNSPFFSSPTEEVEAQIQDKLQESQPTVEEKADLQEQQDNDKAEEVKEDGGSPEEAPPASLENGQQEPPVVGDAMSASPEDEADSGPAKMDNGLESLQVAGAQPALNTEAGPAPEEAEVIPNGIPESKEEPAADPAPEPPRQDEEANAEVPQSAPDTPAQEEEGGAENPAPLQPGKDVEDEDAGEIIRAERVIVTDDGDEPADTENSSASVEVPVPEEPKPDPAEAPKDEEAAEAGQKPKQERKGMWRPQPGLPSAAPQPEAVGEGVKPEEKAEAPAPAVVAGQFQDIPLDGSAKPEAVQPVAGTTETPAVPAEQQTLLDPSKTAPARAEAGDTPKRKTCQCCSVM
ncbi:hypothetical protein COCON_G00026000 [Conger conger]|uniref:Paralemmin n=1 Tax=Conger conger TaxID=82655 RepID=A0A9Q1DXN3_CONCO|nr:hypothetical protein COCON_G00026000 [Conger conger]